MIGSIKKYMVDNAARILSMPALVWQLFFFVVPLVFIILISFVNQWEFGFASGFTLKHYLSFFMYGVYAKILIKSFGLALWISSLCLLVAYPLAYYLAFVVQRSKNMLLFFLIVPFWTNFLIQVYAWFFVLEKEGFVNNFLRATGLISEPLHLLNNFFAITLVMFYCYLPFMVLPIFSILEKFDRTLIESSLDLGATYMQTLRRVIIPLSMSGIQTGFFLVFVPAFGEFVIPMLVGGDKHMYNGGLITYFFLYAQNASLGAAFTVFSSIVLVCTVLIGSWYMFTISHVRTKGNA